MNCLNDIRVCTTCDIANGYYLYKRSDTDVICVKEANFPKGFGVDSTDNSAIKECSVTNCANCKTSNIVCVACDYANGYLFYKAANNQVSCLLPANIPKGFGVDSADPASIKECSLANCADCKLNN